MEFKAEDIRQKIIFLEDVFESIPIGIIILDSSGRILMMNRWQENISKVKREQVIGRYFHDTWKRLFDQGIYDTYWDLLRKKESYDMILHEVYPQFFDSKITAIARGNPLSSGNGFVLLHEVSEAMKRDRRGIEKLAGQLADSTNFLENLIDSSPNIVISTDQAYVIKSANKTSVRIFGYSKGQFVGRHISFLFENNSELDSYNSKAKKETGVEVWCKKRNGKIFPAKMKLRDIKNKNGENQAMLFLLNDLTKEKEMEAKLVLSEKLAIYSELMAGIAHQINNPLVGVINFSALLLEKMAPKDSNRELVETISQAAQECHKLISSMTKNIWEPRSTFHMVDLKEVLESAIRNVWKDEIKSGAKIVLRRKVPEGLPEIKGDSLQLLQVFRNLLANAIQAMPNGGKLEVGTKVDRKRKLIHVCFSDTGCGIPQENLSHIFEPFFSTKKKRGTGLGLSFAFQVVKAHSGRVDVTSVEGKGSQFTVVLPYRGEEIKH